ncbi:MAG: lytic transglycosylase domain-containing protein [Gaiellales bacterium]
MIAASRPGRLWIALATVALLALGIGVAVIVLERDMPAWYARLRYPIRYEHIIAGHAENYRLDGALIAAVIYRESEFDADAVSRAGAVGLMQLLPDTAAGIATLTGGNAFEPNDLYNPEINVRYGSFYLRRLVDKYDSVELALAAYNAGQANVDRWLAEDRGIAFPETRDFVHDVLELQEVYDRAYGSRIARSTGEP